MSSDYFMRQLEGVTELLSYAMFGKTGSQREEIVHETAITADVQSLLIDLRFLVTSQQINEAEDLLFEALHSDPDRICREVVDRFYDWLDDLDAEELVRCNYSREEVAEGRQAARCLCRPRQSPDLKKAE